MIVVGRKALIVRTVCCHREGERLGKAQDATATAAAAPAESGLLEPIQIQMLTKNAGIGLHQPPVSLASTAQAETAATGQIVEHIEKKTNVFRQQQMVEHHLRRLQRDINASRRILQDLDEKHVPFSLISPTHIKSSLMK